MKIYLNKYDTKTGEREYVDIAFWSAFWMYALLNAVMLVIVYGAVFAAFFLLAFYGVV
jgi:hypothetical protein